MNAEAAARLVSHKPNQLTNAKRIELLGLLIKSAIQPFNALMLAVAVLSVAHPSSDWETFTLVMVSTINRSNCLCMTARLLWGVVTSVWGRMLQHCTPTAADCPPMLGLGLPNLI